MKVRSSTGMLNMADCLLYKQCRRKNSIARSSGASPQWRQSISRWRGAAGCYSGRKRERQIIDAAYYYMNTFVWGASAVNESAVVDNSYIKLREVVLGYTLPAKLTRQVAF